MKTANLSDAKVSLLARYLHGHVRATPEMQTIPRRDRAETIPLSYGQEQVWLHAQMAPDLPVYNEPITIHYTGRLDVVALERSFNEILRRHEAWRVRFVAVEGTPVQEVEPTVTVSLPLLDLRTLSKEQRESEALRIATEDAAKPIELSRVPLFRTKLVRMADEEYRLYLTLSHIIFDGIAIYRVLLPELSMLYDAFSSGKASPLPELAVQYTDYACWQRRHMPPETFADALEYWKRELGDGLPELYLPTDRPRLAQQTFRGSMYPFKLGDALIRTLRAFCRAERVSLFSVLLAGFAVLLYRFSGEEVIPIGTVTSGRNRPEVQSLLGYFLNTVVLKTDLSGKPSFRELVQRVRDVIVGALEHDNVPFEYLVRELQSKRDRSHNPFFQALFSLEPPLPKIDPAWRLTQMDIDTSATKYDVYLESDDRGEEIIARFHYNTDLFDEATIVRMATCWQTLLEAACKDPSLSVATIPVLPAAERQRILKDWNETVAMLPQQQLLHAYFEDQVQKTPGAIAVTFEGQQLSYRELNDRANRVAHYLRRFGVGPDVPVGLFLDRSLNMVIGILGILKAGGAYLPLDPNYPADRLAFMLADANPPVVLTEASFARALPKNDGTTIVRLDADARQFELESEENLRTPLTGENLAYVIFTSGSTGRPKGVLNVHRGIVNRLLWMQNQYHLNPTDRILQKTPFTFDVSVWEFFWPLITGARLIVARPEGQKDPEYLVNLINAQRITTIHFVPSMLRAFLDTPGVENCISLRRVICSGEALPFELQKRFFECLETQLHNLYGPTEASVDVTYWQCMKDATTTNVPIGKPIWNTQIYVLDRDLQPVPTGAAGELHIGGVGLARGYLNRPELTAAKFIPDPFSSEPGARLYKTGDLARYRSDGNIEFLGRIDDQVKIRGFRIELGEIQTVLQESPGVRECCVVVREDIPGDRRLAGYVVPRDISIDLGLVSDTLRKKLPDYMVPALVLVESIPLTANGKLNRRALPAPEVASLEEEYEPPRDSLERLLADVWADVLKVKRISVYDNFFDLGGHSLSAMQVVAQLQNRIGLRISPNELAFQTLGQLAASCGDRLGNQ